MILETIAIRTVWAKAWAAIKAVPWWVWIGLAVVALWFVDRNAQYREGYENGAESVKAELRAAQAKATEKALEAVAEADEKAIERAEAEARVAEDMIDRIESAEAEGSNPLDALFQ